MPNRIKIVKFLNYLIDARQKVICPNSNCNYKGFGIPSCSLSNGGNQSIGFMFGGSLVAVSILLQYWFFFEPDMLEKERSIKTFLKHFTGSLVCFTIGIILIRFRHGAYACPQCWLELPTKKWKELNESRKPQKVPNGNFWT